MSLRKRYKMDMTKLFMFTNGKHFGMGNIDHSYKFINGQLSEHWMINTNMFMADVVYF